MYSLYKGMLMYHVLEGTYNTCGCNVIKVTKQQSSEKKLEQHLKMKKVEINNPQGKAN